jgi:hypothetical protein
VALALLGASPRPAAAQSCVAQGSGASAAEAEGRRLYEEGVEAAAARDWEKARERFGEACRRIYHPFIFASLGQVELELGMNRSAAEHLSRFLRAAPPDEEPAKMVKVRELLERAKGKIGAVKIQGAADGAEVSVDGASVGRAPLRGPIFVEPGLREFVARPAAGVPQRSLRFIATGATVDVDLSALMSDEPPGPRSSGGASAADAAYYKPGVEKESWLSRPAVKVGIIGITAGAVTAAVGGAFLIYHEAIPDLPQLDSYRRTIDPQWEAWADKKRNAFNIGTIGLGAGAGLGLVGGAVLLFDSVGRAPDAPMARDKVSIRVAPTGSGFGVVGRW